MPNFLSPGVVTTYIPSGTKKVHFVLHSGGAAGGSYVPSPAGGGGGGGGGACVSGTYNLEDHSNSVYQGLAMRVTVAQGGVPPNEHGGSSAIDMDSTNFHIAQASGGHGAAGGGPGAGGGQVSECYTDPNWCSGVTIYAGGDGGNGDAQNGGGGGGQATTSSTGPNGSYNVPGAGGGVGATPPSAAGSGSWGGGGGGGQRNTGTPAGAGGAGFVQITYE